MQNNNSNSNKRTTIGMGLMMWGICAVFYGYQYLLQVSPSVMTQDLMRDFNINATALGNLVACYFYTYAMMQIPTGMLLDYFGARKLLTAAAIVCAIGCFLFAGTHLFTATWGRLLIGVGAAFPVIGCMYIAATWFPTKYFALLNGLVLTIGMIGAIGGQSPLAMLINAINWRHTMILFAVIGLIIALALWFIIKDKPKTQPEANQPEKTSIMVGLKHVTSCKQSWLIAIYGGLMFMPISVFGSLWGVPFLMSRYHVTNADGGAMLTMLFVGLLIGTPLFGWLSDHMGRRNPIMLLSGIGTLVSIVLTLYMPNLSHFTASALLFSFGFFTGAFLISFAVIREIDTTNSPGTAVGFMNMLNMLGGAALQPLVGFILDSNWHNEMVNGARSYDIASFQLALSLLPLGVVIAIMILPWIKETYCGNAPDNT